MPKGIYTKINICSKLKKHDLTTCFIPEGIISAFNAQYKKIFKDIKNENDFVSMIFKINNLYIYIDKTFEYFSHNIIYHQKSVLFVLEECKYLELYKCEYYIKVFYYL